MKRKLLLGLGLLLMLNLVACNLTTIVEYNSSITILDAFGDEISLDKPANRIISTYSAITENIYALGAGDSLIGGGKTEAYPLEATQLPSFSYSNDDVEKFIAADPDVIFFRKTIALKYTDLITELKNVGIIVIALDNENFENYIITIAKVVDKQDTAMEKLDEFKSQLNILENRAKKVPENEKLSVFFESTENNFMTASQNSIAYLGLERIGVYNVADEDMEKKTASTIAHFGEEYLLAQANNIDVYIAQHGAMNKTVNIESIKQRPGFNIIKAIKEDKILIIDEKLISSPTFRQIEGLKQIFEYIYPQY